MKRKRIMYIQYTNPAGYPPLEHGSRILADAGWDVLFLGTGALGTDKLRLPPHERISVRQLRFQAAGWKQKLHFLSFQIWCLGWMLRWRPSWLYVSDHFSCLIGRIAGRLGLSTVFHEHDSPMPDRPGAFMGMLLGARKQFAKTATLCVVPNAKRAESMLELMGLSRLPVVVWNCPRRDEVAPLREKLSGDSLRLLYHGSIVPDRLPVSVIDSLALLPKGVSLTVVGYETVGAPGYIARLRTRAAELGIAERLRIVGTLATRREMMEVCRQHDVGLALMPSGSIDPNLLAMTGASNKPFDYLACGLALLVSRLPDWEDLFVRTGYGISCDPASPQSLARALAGFHENPEETRAMGERGRQRVMKDWNYEYQFRPVRDKLAGVNSDRSAAPQPALEPYRSEVGR